MQCEIICADLCFGVSVGSALQLHDWCRESKNCKENALLLNDFRPYFCKPLYPSLDYLVKSPLELEKLVFSETNYKIIKMIFRILNKIIIHDDDDYDPNHIGCLDR